MKSEISIYFYAIKVEQHHIKLIQLSYMQMHGYAKMQFMSQCMKIQMCVCELCAMCRCSASVPKNYVLVLTFQHNFNAQNKPQINDSMHVT